MSEIHQTQFSEFTDQDRLFLLQGHYNFYSTVLNLTFKPLCFLRHWWFIKKLKQKHPHPEFGLKLGRCTLSSIWRKNKIKMGNLYGSIEYAGKWHSEQKCAFQDF